MENTVAQNQQDNNKRIAIALERIDAFLSIFQTNEVILFNQRIYIYIRKPYQYVLLYKNDYDGAFSQLMTNIFFT